MSMHVCGQTLVLVDNDMSVSEVNRKLVLATLKYMFYHRPEDRAFCVSTYEHDITGQEEYLTETNDLVCMADTMEYQEKDSNLADTLAEVMTRWKDSDFACRDILVFTDGIEGAALNHEKEELNYLLENCGYPVYVVLLNQEDNAQAKKGLLSIAVPSGGRLFETEFPGSEAALDRLLTEKVYAAMDEYALANWKKYEDPVTEEGATDETATDGETPEEAAVESEIPDEASESEVQKEAGPESGMPEETVEEAEYMADAQPEERVVYEYTKPEETPGMTMLLLSGGFVAVGLIAAVFGGFLIMKKRRSGKRVTVPAVTDDEEYFEDYELKGMGTTELTETYDSDTVFLGEPDNEKERATRLLGETRFVCLTDKEDKGRMLKIMLGAPMTLGRGNCDVVISGDDAVSKRHCEIFERDGEAFVRDLSSSNGTKLNDVRIQEEHLSDGDELTIGTKTYRVGLA